MASPLRSSQAASSASQARTTVYPITPAKSVAAAPPDDAPSRSIVTFLTPAERQRVDALGQGSYTTVHRESFEDMLRDLRTQPVSAILVSVSRYQQHHATQVARMVREFPRVPAVALLTGNEARTTQSLLALGQQGVQTLVDARDPAGWRDLRQFVNREVSTTIEAVAIRRIRADLTGANDDCLRFFDELFLAPRSLTTVRQLARRLGVVPTTFMSRFFRAGIPAPKKYLATARLVRAARLLENPGYSLTQVAFLLEYSSPQSFSRHVTQSLQCGAAEFRKRYSGEAMLEHMRQRLILPYQQQLIAFVPVEVTPQWISRPALVPAASALPTAPPTAPPRVSASA
ncbi:helix-turn-helix transcriptional regulator [Gemmatimonas groenlandica]|uniref:Helix-turn-helix domain-containing protein n=1 Tax=Gemmatimonas groenlandica TaxID=2732249 RepID=A0A6M4IQ65_9BACT|nr:helix-turn-helix domain-containing protein [Gemmatimonas groenlandica]QJR36860.1 helix-turn-helix domain-containing protein [Gemmatimonas groenlandica]